MNDSARPAEPAYLHTQRGGWHWVLLAFAVVFGAGAWLIRYRTLVAVEVGVLAAFFVVVALAFARLTIRDEGSCLGLHYGPLPIFRRRIRYADVTAVEPGRTAVIDGWGIHWIPGRGMTYNLWGFACVKLTVAGKTVRVGSDDAGNLAAFLRGKIETADPAR